MLRQVALFSTSAMKRRLTAVMSGPKEIASVDFPLSDMEEELFTILRKASKGETVVRVAGGWVRDKLLGRENHDIDIALDNMTGNDFAQQVNQELVAGGKATHKIGVIERNPEQSKHLETATVKILGLPIDFVNLRAEEYASESRIPIMRFGTAEEDANRRDFTINALFYNVSTDQIEDFTGRGFCDLKLGLIRTPLEPRVTLLDDPLRVLRAVRFSARYGFEMVPELQDAVALEEVREALRKKVSRERVRTELDGMLTGPRPIASVRLLHTLDLLPIVLSVPDGIHPSPSLQSERLKERAQTVPKEYSHDCAIRAMSLVNVVNVLLSGYSEEESVEVLSTTPSLPDVSGEKKEETKAEDPNHPKARLPFHPIRAKSGALFVLKTRSSRSLLEDAKAEAEGGKDLKKTKSFSSTTAAAVVPERQQPHKVTGVSHPDFATYADVTNEDLRILLLACLCEPLAGFDGPLKGTRTAPAISLLLRQLKTSNRDMSEVNLIARSAWVCRDLFHDPKRLKTGLMIKETKDLWPLAVELGVAIDSIETDSDVGKKEIPFPPRQSLHDAVARAEDFVKKVHDWKLHEAHLLKPLLSGKDLIGLGAPKGKMLGSVVDELSKWHLLHPDATKQEAEDFIVEYIKTMQ